VLIVESAFEDALSFIPERWYNRPEMIKDKSAFAPFGVGTLAPPKLLSPMPPNPQFHTRSLPLSLVSNGRTLAPIKNLLQPHIFRSEGITPLTELSGRRICVGKNLALTQIRLVTSVLLRKYRVCFVVGENGEGVERDMRDQLTAVPGKCRVVFEAR